MTAPIRLPPIERSQLENGLRIVVAARKGIPLAAVRLVMRGGASLDPAGRSGLAHLAALSARRGGGRRSGAEIDRLVEELGADLGAGVDEDATYLGLSAPSEALARCLEVTADVAAAPTFPAAEVARLRRREVASLAHDLDEPAVVADRAMLAAAYGDHPYAHPPEGRARDLGRLGRPDVVAFHRRHYHPASAILLVVGAVSTGEVLELARRRFGRWRSTGDPAPALPAPAPLSPLVLLVDKPDLTQVQVRIASSGFDRRSPDYHAGMVASAVLGGGFTSRLMEAIRVNRGLSYGVRSRFATSGAGGIFYVSSFTKVETAGELVGVALDEVARFAEGGPTAEELERTQSYLCGLFPLSLETHDQLAERLADLALWDLGVEEVTGFRERIRGVTGEACRAVARRYFPLDRRVIVVVGPAAAVRKQLDHHGEVRVVPARRIFVTAPAVAVLHEDAQLLAIDKPAGRLVIPGRGRDEQSLVEELSATHGRLWVVHRLDRGTSGVLLFARTAEAHRAVNMAFDRGEPRKRYLALVRGAPPAEARVEVAIAPARRGRMRPASADDPRGKPSATAFRLVEAFPARAWAGPGAGGALALVEALPETGRTHQIRVHLAAAGWPLAVDPDYGEAEPLRGPDGRLLLDRTPLHAERLELAHPATGASLVLRAPLPGDLEAALAALRSPGP